MSPTALPRTLQAIENGIARGWQIGAQVFVSLRGQEIANLGIGQSRPGAEMTPQTVMLWLSACKPIGAVAIAQLIERGHLALDTRVADVIPEFGKLGKEPVTVRHVLTHTCGFRFGETGWPAADWEEIISRVCDIRLERNWTIGETAGYHPNTSWFIVGEIVRRLDGRPYEQYVRDEIFVPLGMEDCWIGMSADRYRGYGSRMEIVQQMDKGPGRALPPWDREESFTHCRPAANGCGPAAQLGRFYQMLLNGGELEGARILQAGTVSQFTSRQRAGLFDLSFKHIVDFGFGFIVNSNRYGADTVPYGFGPCASDETFGHNGFQSTSAFADPRHGLVAVIIPNGTPGDVVHEQRLREMLGALYEDLGLAGQ